MSLIDDIAKKRMAGIPKPTAPASKPTPKPAVKSSLIDEIAEKRKASTPSAPFGSRASGAPADSTVTTAKPKASTDVSREAMRKVLMTPVPEKVIDLGNGVKEIHLPGGEVWRQDAAGNPVETSRSVSSKTKAELRGGKSFEQTGLEVDHLIPKALGGTDDDTNLRAAQSRKTISQAVYDFVTGNKRLPGDYLPKNRQEGKMVVEWEAIEQYRAGNITLPQARAAVTHYDNPDFVSFILGSGVGRASQVETPEMKQQRSALEENGDRFLGPVVARTEVVPETVIRAAPAGMVKPKDNFLKKVGRVLLPKDVEIALGISEGQVQMSKADERYKIESDRLNYLRLRTLKTSLEENVSPEQRTEFDRRRASPEDDQDVGVLSTLKRAAVNSWYSQIRPFIGTLAEIHGTRLGNPDMVSWGIENGDEAVAEFMKRPELLPGRRASTPLLEGGIKDPIAIANTIGSVIPFAATVIGTSALGGLVAGPAGSYAGSFAAAASIESSNAYRDMIEEGIAPDDAGVASQVYGSIAAFLENATGFKPSQIGNILIKKFYTNEAKEAVLKPVFGSFKEYLRKELPRLGKETLTKVAQEGEEEGIQQLAQNLITGWLDNSKNVWEGVAESVAQGAVGSLAFAPADIITSDRPGISVGPKNDVMIPAIQAVIGETQERLKEGARPEEVILSLSRDMETETADAIVAAAQVKNQQEGQDADAEAGPEAPAVSPAPTPDAAAQAAPAAPEATKAAPEVPGASQTAQDASSVAAKTSERLAEMGAKVLKQTPADLHNEFMRSQDRLEGEISSVRARVAELEDAIDSTEAGTPENQSAVAELDALTAQVEASESRGTEEFQVYGSHLRSQIRARVSAAYPSASEDQIADVIDDTLDVITDGEAAAAMYSRPIEEIADLMATRTLGETEKAVPSDEEKAKGEAARAERRKAGAAKAEENRKAASEKKTVSKQEKKPAEKKALPAKKTDVEKRAERREKTRIVKEKRGEKVSEKKSVSKEKLSDVGEKIGGANKDRITKIGEKYARKLTIDEIIKLSTAESLPRIDYKQLMELGVGKETIYVLAMARASTGMKPRSRYELRRWAENVLAIRGMYADILAGGVSNDRAFQAANNFFGEKTVAATFELYDKLDFFNSPVAQEYYLRPGRLAGNRTTLFRERKFVRDFTIVDGKVMGGQNAIEAIAEYINSIPTETKGRKERSVADNINLFRKRTGEVVAAFKKGSIFHEFEVFANLEAGRAAIKDPKNIEKWVKELEVMTDFDKNSFRGTTTGVIKRDYRNGRDVTAQEFMDTFGMRGVEFGNWVTGDERQERVNAAFDSFKDLARILDIPDAAIGLNGELGFAFGSRGRKGAIAHYEAEKIVINITRHDGAGTLAHEWWHAFDNYLARRDEKTRSFVTGSGYSRVDLDQKIKALMTYIRGSDLYKRSSRADSFKSKRYFVEPTELGARAFEVFVKESLTDLGLTNNFLVNVINSKDLKPGLDDMYPYATGDEIEPVKNLMGEIFEEVRVDETTDKKAMFKLDVRQTEVGIQSAAEAVGVLEDYKERLGIDFDVKFVDAILVGSDPSGFAKMRGIAQGATLDNTIVLLKEMSATTAEHETVHLTMANLDKIEAFKAENITRDKLLAAKAQELGIDVEGNERVIEEEIAHGFEEYVAGKEKAGILRKFFAVLKKLLVRFVSAFAKSNGNIVRDYYDILSDGRSAAGAEVVLGNRGLVEHFIENGAIHLSPEAAEFKFDKEADPRWRQVEQQFNEASEKLDALKADLIAWRGDINRLLEKKAASKEAAAKISETARELSRFTVKKTGKLTERGLEEAKKLGIDLAAVEPEISEYLKRRAEIQEASVALAKLRDKIADGRKRKFGDAMMLRQVKRKLRFREALLGSRPFRSGFVAGKAEGEKGMKLDLLAQMRRRDADIEDIRRQVREMVVDRLPQERRGRFVPMVSRAKTLRDLVDAYFRVTAAVTRMRVEENAEIIRATLKRVKDAVAGGKGIAVEYQKRILNILEGVDFKRPTVETISRLQRLAQYVAEHGETHGVPQEYLDQLKRLSRKPLAEMSLEDLEALAVRLETLEEQGRLKLNLLTARTEREQAAARAALIAGTRNLDVIAPSDTDPTWWKEKLQKNKNLALRFYHFFRVADILDGRKDYRGENVRLQRSLAHAETRAKTRAVEAFDEAMKQLAEVVNGDHEWTKEENDAMTFHLLLEQGATDAANNLANARNWTAAPAKTADMARAMDIMRASFEARRDELADVYEAETNKPFRPVERYFPIKYEKLTQMKEEPSIEELLNIAGVARTKTAQGFTISRVKNVERVPRTDWLAVFEEATREQTWFIEVQPAIINAKALVQHPEYEAVAGRLATELWRDLLSNLAKRGRTDFDPISRWTAEKRMSINRAVLGYRVSSIAIQPFAIVEALAYVQGMKLNNTSGKTAALRVLGGFARSWTSPAFFRNAMAQSEMLRLRAGGEQAIEEQLEAFEGEDSWFAKFQRGGLKLLSAADVRTAAGVQRGLYDTFIADGMAENDARLHADFIMNVVSGSSEIADRPLAMSGKSGEMMKTVLTFQSFALNVWGIMWHDLIRSRLITRGGVSDKANAVIGLGLLTLSQMGQQVLRDAIKDALTPGDDDDDKKKKDAEGFMAGFWEEAKFLIPNQVPILGNIVQAVERTGEADFNIPLARPFVDFVSGLNDMAKAGVTTGPKSAAYRERGMVNMASAVSTIFGIAGTSQATDVLKKTFGVGGATPDAKDVRAQLLQDAAKKDSLDAEELAKQVADPEKWEATDEAGEKYRRRLIAQVEQEYVLVTKYPKSDVAAAVMGNPQLKDRIAALMELADKVGIEKVAEEIVAMRSDSELQGPKGSGVSDFISSNLYKAFREAETAYKAASASK